MPVQLSEMDDWSKEQVSLFKRQARNKQLEKIPAEIFSLEIAADSKTIVAEGDSWFDYLPGTDIIDCLRYYHDYVIYNNAKAGDTLENMIYGTDINGRFERVNPTIDKVLRQLERLKPKVFLFSGGGNDVAGEEFDSYLNHKDSGLPAMRAEFVDRVMNEVFRKYFEDLIAKVAVVAPETHLVVHGYGHTAPTGEGVDFLFFTFAGPWMRPVLAKKGIIDPAEQRNIVFTLVDKYNEMLNELAQNNSKFHHIDLRDMLDPDRDWVNELHLRNSAFARVAQRIDDVIQTF